MINIVFCLDKNIKESLKATITSILHHTKREINFYLICPKDDNLIFEEYIKSLSLPKINLGNFEPSEEILRIIENCSYCSGSRVANYSRFFIKSIFPKLEKVIYLDTDIIVLDDIGKMWDQGEFNSEIFLAAPKYIIYHKLFYIKKLSYYFSYLNKNKYFFNGGVFMTNLKYWDNKFYQKLYRVTEDIMSNDISHVFTEILLNVMFPKFIPLDPAWNCSGYGTPHLYPIIKTRDYNMNPKILHWSGGCKPWSNKDIFKQKIWNYYLNDKTNGVYLLYYDDQLNNEKTKYLLNSIKEISYNLIVINLFEYEKVLNIDFTQRKDIKRYLCLKHFIDVKGSDNYYFVVEPYNTILLKFDYEIIDYIEDNNVKILCQSPNLDFGWINCFNSNTNNFTNSLVDFSEGIFNCNLIGKGNYLLELFNRVYDKNYNKKINELLCIDKKYFLNVDNIFKGIEAFDLKISDIKIYQKLNPSICLVHYKGANVKNKFDNFKVSLNDTQINDLKFSNFRYLIFRIYYFLLSICYNIYIFFISICYKIFFFI
jgi:lipopolysaccharide biosynthesis glycosyltransferase